MSNIQLTPKQEVKIQGWLSVIKERNQTGETVSQICQRKSLSRNAYYYWLRKIQTLALDELKESNTLEFVKLPKLDQIAETQLQLNNMESQPPVSIELKSCKIQIQENCSQELILKLLRGLKDA